MIRKVDDSSEQGGGSGFVDKVKANKNRVYGVVLGFILIVIMLANL